MVNRRLLISALYLMVAMSAFGQNVDKYYVSKPDMNGTIYHTMPCTLFRSSDKSGDLTFDLSYCDNKDGVATLNFTYQADEVFPADSASFVSGSTVLRGAVQKIYIQPHKKQWKHRYSLGVNVELLHSFFDESTQPEVRIYSHGVPHVYEAKLSSWRSYAPIGRKIFEVIRVNQR